MPHIESVFDQTESYPQELKKLVHSSGWKVGQIINTLGHTSELEQTRTRYTYTDPSGYASCRHR